MNLLLLGKPGAGKGSQAELLIKKYKFFHMAPGDHIRAEIKKKTKLGRKFAAYAPRGKLIPGQLIEDMVKAKIKGKKKVLFDGFPRTVSQANALESFSHVDIVIDMNVPDSLIISRLSSRRVCKCGATFNLVTKKPKKAGICDECGSRLYQRDDDRSSTVRKRLVVYAKQTKPLISFYKRKGILHRVNGAKLRMEVFKDIQKIVKV